MWRVGRAGEDGPNARTSAPSINFQTGGTKEMRRRRNENVTKQQVKKGALFDCAWLAVDHALSFTLKFPPTSGCAKMIIMQSHLSQLFASHLPSSVLHKHPLSTRDGRGHWWSKSCASDQRVRSGM